ncbi:hypothetical protein M2459_002781 [Parabacteroides sp. PF5-5]|uniref:hypothetical protein n=1 Tax=unclassified Parabacteroides TaxID=2649774 RepID=UPI0024754B91|nr:MULTISPECIES: hypothetical protein [unclassified Parabacteroides]MDH6306075.1 hypothetical protein [Parabacteroides sp. PH5-39]MDH6317027.1 hypothetical protein [Parabacteroides sp. PF5-13]MDH6320780.1 hypothetical protein [Parabacteroides sp. PH5-13]MDH6324518.1 hypothetical protein [Parabacteroides sp. PH5-8]MDH6328212.1 hypothetical protein [Parabacteroides sp. PH5-41]
MRFLGYFCNILCKNQIFILTFVAVMILSPLGIDAQEKGRPERQFDKEVFLAKKRAFITAELSLTPEEAADFMPLCEELQQKKFEAGHKCRKISKEMKSKTSPTDVEYVQVIDECLNVGLKEAELEKEYYEKFKKILPPAKLYKYRDAEFKFAREFMRGSREKRNNNKDR